MLKIILSMLRSLGRFLRFNAKVFSGVFSAGFALIIVISMGAFMASDVDNSELDESGYQHVYGEYGAERKLLKVNVFGPILGTYDESYDRFGFSNEYAYGYSIKDTLRRAAEDRRIKGIFLHVNTPGGTIFGSRAIDAGIREYKEETGNPVLVFIEGLSASGGVMATANADVIMADYGSMVGSVGVIGPVLGYFNGPVAFSPGLFSGGITTKEGIEMQIISSGKGKDLGNPFRRASEEEVQILQDSSTYQYEQFVQHVAEGRQIKAHILKEEMGAHIFGNQQAQSYGLIDETGSYHDALDKLLTLSGTKGPDYELITPGYKGGFWSYMLSGSVLQSFLKQPAPYAQLCSIAQHHSLVMYSPAFHHNCVLQ